MAALANASGPDTAMDAGPFGFASAPLPRRDNVAARLDALIHYSLDKLQYRNAVFLAERLMAQAQAPGTSDSSREHATFLLATCHYRRGRPEMARSIVENRTSLRCRYLFAKCSLDLRRYVEANRVLEGLLKDETLPRLSGSDFFSEQHSSRSGSPDRSSVLCLLGHVVRAQQRHKLAARYYKEALELNPFLWEAYERLCHLGDLPDTDEIFNQFEAEVFDRTQRIPALPPALQRTRTQLSGGTILTTSQEGNNINHNNDKEQDENNMQGSISANTRRKRTGSPEYTLSKPTFVPSNSSNNGHPHGSLRASIHDSPEGISFEKTPTPVMPSLKREASLGLIANPGVSTERVPLKRGQKRNGLERTRSTSTIIAPASGGVRKRAEKSNTLATTSLPSVAATLKLKDALSSGQAQSPMTASSSANSGTSTPSGTSLPLDSSDLVGSSGSAGLTAAPPSPNAEVDLWLQREALRAMVKIFRILARAYGLLALNKHAECIKDFESLPTEHLLTGWVQCQMAKCKFQTNDHVAAETYFARARELEPYIQSDMELYSTCLWHLQKEVALSNLSKELKDLNHLSPEAWVALGNAYSLKHDRDQALKCFERAIQLDDTFAYAHTLIGHEYVENEEFDRAQAEYRTALSIDPRSFYAWYGLGLIYHKTGKDDLALVHYLEAKHLNPNHSVVLFWVGTIQERLNRLSEAIRSFDEALRVDPTNASARYRRAKVLVDMRQLDEAFQDLEELRQMTPNEPNIYLLQGRILKQRGQKEEALRYLTWALELDTKSSHTIRDMIAELDGRHPEDEEDEQQHHYDM